jgi:energy-coupling factor transport system permease protein
MRATKLHADAFSGCNPIVNFMYFAFVLGITIFFLHPVLLGISFVSGMVYSIYLNGGKAVKFNLAFLLPLMVAAAVINPAFNHQGVTILTYVRMNPITLESILYGIAAAVMIGSVILWFSCYNAVMTSDKFLYLFGRIIPALSLIISMALRFVPRYKAQIKRITNAQRGIGRDVSSGNVIVRIRSGLSILSILVTWALENAIETADSMKSRGYGLKGRTAYSNFRFDFRDRILVVAMLLFFAGIIASIALHRLSVLYFPAFVINVPDGFVLVAYAEYLIICTLPLMLDIREDLIWRTLRLKIVSSGNKSSNGADV